MTTLPNFLIVGAAKSGTTTISYYLEKNKKVFMSFPKEPKFFSYRHTKYNGIGDKTYTKNKCTKDFESYKKLFSKSKGFDAIGEASVDNLFYHNQVINDIKEKLGDPKIIIVLRNPVDRAFSAYSHMIRDGREKFNFDIALEKEEQRLENGYEFIWGYKKCGLYYNQVKDYLENFSAVKIVIFEDLINHEQKELNSICEFLGVKNIKVEDNLRLNASGRSKSRFIHFLISRDTWIRRIMTSFVGTKNAIKIKSYIQKKNIEKLEIPLQLKQKLQHYFLNDITKLEQLIEKDLSMWKNKY